MLVVVCRCVFVFVVQRGVRCLFVVCLLFICFLFVVECGGCLSFVVVCWCALL